MKVVALNDRQRKKIVRFVKPERNDLYSYQNLNLLTAVYDENKNIYLTEMHYLSAAIQRTEERYGTHQYILLTPLCCFQVGWKEAAGNDQGVFSSLPILLPNRAILDLIQYYQNSFSERFQLKKELLNGMDLGDMGFTEWYLTRYYWKS